MSLYNVLTPSFNGVLPSIKDEEYRYSGVLPAIEKLTTLNQGVEVKTPWNSTYTFTAGQPALSLPKKPFASLPSEFQQFKNYFKQAGLATDSTISELSFPTDTDELHLSFVASKNAVNSHKTYIHVGKDRSVRIYVHMLSQENSLMIPQIYLDAQENSHIELVYVADKSHNKGLLSPIFEMISHENAHTSFQTLCSGLDYQRLTFMGYVKGIASHIDLRTGFYLKKNERCDLYVRIFHHGADSTSNQIIKAVTLDEAQMNFNAQIYASPDAKNIYAYQKLTGMLLGEKSQIFARPQLDIEYYELACSHGVSIGGFDPEELFYAQSRGIPAKDIYPLLLYGFFSEPFVELPLEDYWLSQVKDTLGVSFV